MPSKNEKISKSMEGNNNAEKWTLEEAQQLFRKALDLAIEGKTEEVDNGTDTFDIKSTTYDFIGEIARELRTYRDVFAYLSEKFPSLSDDYKELISALEANCFSHGKNGDIIPSMAIMNLKSNHGWTDRVDNTTKGDKVEIVPISKEALKKAKEELDDEI